MTKTPNMPEGSGDRTPEKEMGLTAGNDQAHTQQNTDANHFTPDPVKGWFDLAANVKPSRDRQKKKTWVRKAVKP